MDSMIGNKIKSLLATISPTLLTKIIYYRAFNKRLDLINPSFFNEKVLALKLGDYYGNDLITRCCDKYEVRSFIHDEGYERLLPTLYKAVDSPEEIQWECLPKSFVIKCTHGSGYNIICSDKSHLDIEGTVDILNKWLSEDYWKKWAETQYKYVRHRIIIEEFLGERINTYKFYCFNGVPKVMYVSCMGEDGEKDKYINFYDMDWNKLDLVLDGHESIPYDIDRPRNFDEMRRIAEKLSEQFKFVRIDLYNINEKIFFSEMTFIPTGGLMKIKPIEVLKEWGEWLEI